MKERRSDQTLLKLESSSFRSAMYALKREDLERAERLRVERRRMREHAGEAENPEAAKERKRRWWGADEGARPGVPRPSRSPRARAVREGEIVSGQEVHDSVVGDQPRGTSPTGGTFSRGRDLTILSSGESWQRASQGTSSGGPETSSAGINASQRAPSRSRTGRAGSRTSKRGVVSSHTCVTTTARSREAFVTVTHQTSRP
jgi:hypothetical protein